LPAGWVGGGIQPSSRRWSACSPRRAPPRLPVPAGTPTVASTCAETGPTMTAILVRVTAVTDETADIRTLRLAREDGAPLGSHRAGAHIDVTGPTGVLRRSSLCGPPGAQSSLLIAVKREPGSRGGSAALHTVAAGDRLTISEPRNLLALAANADRHVLVAGGIGVTPLL